MPLLVESSYSPFETLIGVDTRLVKTMRHGLTLWLLSVAILLLVACVSSAKDDLRNEHRLKTAVYLSPKIVLEPGKVSNKFYENIDFPKGHIAIKKFYAELVDEQGKSVPLHETYIHHWTTTRYYQRDGAVQSDSTPLTNSGMCKDVLTHYFGVGAETRKTFMRIPDPYGIEVGNPLDIPSNFTEKWLFNIHVIDLRGTQDKLGCTECRCNLYNVTKDEDGQPLPLGYQGGVACCYDGVRCRLKKGFHGVERNIFLKYRVEYVEWVDSMLPIKIYIIDITDKWNRLNESAGHNCLMEYDVKASSVKVDTKKLVFEFPINADVIYGTAHQHAAGLGMTLYRKNGSTICSSIPVYGEGKEAGNEAGFIVGQSSCYPKPGSVKISKGELLTLDSKYSSRQRHTGVMGLLHLYVADSTPRL